MKTIEARITTEILETKQLELAKNDDTLKQSVDDQFQEESQNCGKISGRDDTSLTSCNDAV